MLLEMVGSLPLVATCALIVEFKLEKGLSRPCPLFSSLLPQLDYLGAGFLEVEAEFLSLEQNWQEDGSRPH